MEIKINKTTNDAKETWEMFVDLMQTIQNMSISEIYGKYSINIDIHKIDE